MVISLFQLLDLLVVNDELIYDADMASVWSHSEGMRPIIPLLSSVKLSQNTKKTVFGGTYFHDTKDTPRIIEEGALFYLKLAKLLGLYYWPSPERAEFLMNKVYSNTTSSSFLWTLSENIDSDLGKIIKEVYASLKNVKQDLKFPGFGSSILANCNSRLDIFPTLFQYRDTKEAIEFRKWLREMDDALQAGNVWMISQGLRDVQELIASLQKELGLISQTGVKVDLQIGLSPSLTIDLMTVDSVLKRFKPKPLHIIFLRNHLYGVLENADVWVQVWRLFPEIRL